MAGLSYPAVQPYYDGKTQQATSGQTFQTIDPSTARPLADVHTASHADVDAAIASAQNAFPSWSATPPVARARVLLKAVALLRDLNDDLARVETHDTGKPFSETSTVDVITGTDVLEYYAGFISGGGLNGETTQLREDAWVYTKKEPLGVCAGIGAWNYPLQIALWKTSPCLAAGNCMVYKPSEFTPLHATRIADVFAQAGLPPGVFNVVHGDGAAVGQYLTSHPSIAKVSFTGQVSTGQKVASSAAHGMKYVTMELGGKSPFVVLPDANVESAVDGAMMANFFSSGQVCTNGTRVFVPQSMKAEFEKTLLQKMKHIRMGPTMDANTNFGPLVSETHFRKVEGYLKHGVDVDKAKVLYDGKSHLDRLDEFPDSKDLQSGYWCPPMVFTDCSDDMKVVREEIFGPAMCILPYSTDVKSSPDDSPTWPSYLSELVRRANDTPMGLAAGVFSNDLSLAHKVVAQLQAGITWVNTWGESPAEMSVGGWKMSGIGVENGRRGIEMWVRNKSTCVEMGGSVVSAFEAIASSKL